MIFKFQSPPIHPLRQHIQGIFHRWWKNGNTSMGVLLWYSDFSLHLFSLSDNTFLESSTSDEKKIGNAYTGVLLWYSDYSLLLFTLLVWTSSEYSTIYQKMVTLLWIPFWYSDYSLHLFTLLVKIFLEISPSRLHISSAFLIKVLL